MARFGRLLILALGLCQTTCSQMAAQQAAQAQQEAQARYWADDNYCRNLGATSGTPVYVQCRMNLDNQRAQAAENNRALVIQHLLNR